MLWVAAAGPAANLVMAILWGLMLKLVYQSGGTGGYWFDMAVRRRADQPGADGPEPAAAAAAGRGRMLYSLLPHRLAYQYARIEPYGMMIVLLLLFSGALWVFLKPILALGSTVVGWFL